jgi:hypothetical protein
MRYMRGLPSNNNPFGMVLNHLLIFHLKIVQISLKTSISIYKYSMNLYEAQQILNENGFIVESLKANRRKFYVMIDNLLKKFDKDSDDYEEPNDAMNDDAIILNRSILRKITKDELQKIVDTCGYQMSVHSTRNGNDIWITPVNTEKIPFNNKYIKKSKGHRVLYHCSHVQGLEETGIRCKSRLKDKEYDVYKDRIYCVSSEHDIEYAASMVSNEHKNKSGTVYVYKILVPNGYEIYPDPTSPAAVYLTNNVPPQNVELIKTYR